MIEIEFGKKFKQPIILALGMFDCVHSAHIELIKKVKSLTKKNNALSAVFTFSNNAAAINKSGKLIYTYKERLKRFSEEGAEVVIFKKAGKAFSKLSALDFLETLAKTLDLKGIVCGEDYRFGKGAFGDTGLLNLFCKKNNIRLEIIKTIYSNNVKVSTSSVKQLLIEGAVEEANVLLVKPYRITGKVAKGSGLGNSLIFATANLKPDKNKEGILEGVYYTKTEIDGKKYKSVTNFGGKPTFNKMGTLCETHVLGFSGSLYNKEITVEFFKRIRNIKKFKNIEELKSQIKEDIDFVKNN